MAYRTLGNSGLKVSTICLGTMQFGWTADKRTTFAILSEYCEKGGNFLDTADSYSSWVEGNPGGVAEGLIGDWLAQSPTRRNALVIASKVGLRMWEGVDGAGLGKKHIVASVEQSLKRLRIETIDLYQAHWPDNDVPIDETLRAFDDLIDQGKVRVIGCSNFDVHQLQTAIEVSRTQNLHRFQTLQPHYNMMRRINFEGGLLDLCQRENIGVIPYSSLARGFLTGKYRAGETLPDKAQASASLSPFFTDRGFAVIDALDRIARRNDTTIASVSIAWLLATPTITSAIIGASSVEQLKGIFGKGNIHLTEAEKEQLDNVTNWTLTEEISNEGLKNALKKSV